MAILRLVRAAEAGLTTGDVAEQTGLHFSTVRAHLERLVEAGLLIKARASDGGPGRPAWRYRAAAPEPAPAPYRTLAAALLEHLATDGGGASAAVQVGQAWGRRLATAVPQPATPVEATVSVLRELGFDPQVASGDEAGEATDAREAGAAGKARAASKTSTAGKARAGGKVRGADRAREADTVSGAGEGRENSPGDVEVHLRTCPFLELVGQQPDVMCALHAGVIRGVLQTTGAQQGEAVLEPFAAPNACVARLRLPADPSARP